MNYQQHMIEVTKAAAKEAFQYARAVPADKAEWSPNDAGRSVLDLCRELAMCPTWCKETIEKEGPPEFNEEAFAAIKKEQEQWKTVDACEAECNRRLDELFTFFGTIPDERLKDTKWLPFDGGRDFTVAEMLDYPRWNFTYHTGQIAYIQTLYGDREMH